MNQEPPKPRLFVGQEYKAALDQWARANQGEIPDFIFEALSQYGALVESMHASNARQRATLRQLRLAFGIDPSSEKRRNSGNPAATPLTKRGRPPRKSQLKTLLDQQIRSVRLAKWHRAQARKHARKATNAEDRMKNLEDIHLTPDEEADIDAEVAEFAKNRDLGCGADPVYASPGESLMVGAGSSVVDVEGRAVIAPSILEGLTVEKTISEQRARFDFSLQVQQINIDVEKAIVRNDDGSTRIISASTREFGPAKYDVTWGFLAGFAVLLAQYAIPMNRIASMLSCPGKTFTSAMLARYAQFIAKRLVPVYLECFRQLSQSNILSGDDTQTRVLEVKRHFTKLKSDPETIPPWASYSTTDLATEAMKQELPKNHSLGVLLGSKLPFVFLRRNGDGKKIQLNTTVIHGRSEPTNPGSTIVFYRSHFGSFGNLLEMMLRSRSKGSTRLVIQSDLATVNLVVDPVLLENFTIKQIGCTSHARRPFAIHAEEDPDNCEHMIHLFKGLYIYENTLTSIGRNALNVGAVRNHQEREVWGQILALARDLLMKWPPKTPIGEACQYIIRHFPELTAYLDDPILAMTNDFSERILRLEKMIQASAMFRNSLNGRFALDVIRTVLQTAVAAEIFPDDYLDFVLHADPEEVAANPSLYMPLHYKHIMEKTPIQ